MIRFMFLLFPQVSKVGIRTAIETITAEMLQTVWNELDIVLMFVESQRVHI